MSYLNQFFPGGSGSGGGGGSTSTLIPTEILVVGGGSYGTSGTSCGCRNPARPAACGQPFYCTYGYAGNGGATIYAQNYMLKKGQTCPIQVGAAAPTGTPAYYSCPGGNTIYGYLTTSSGTTSSGGSSFFGGTSGLCASGSCTEAVPLTSPYGVSWGCICSNTGSTNVSNTQSYDLYITTGGGGKVTTGILGPTICVFGSPGAGSCSSNPSLVAFGCTLVPAEIMCINYGGANSGAGSGMYSDLQPWHPGYPDTNIPSCCGAKAGTVIVKYPADFGPSPSYPGACDCSPQTPGYYTYRFVSPGSIVLPS